MISTTLTVINGNSHLGAPHWNQTMRQDGCGHSRGWGAGSKLARQMLAFSPAFRSNRTRWISIG